MGNSRRLKIERNERWLVDWSRSGCTEVVFENDGESLSLTGGGGFIGSHLVEALSVDDRYELIAVADHFSTGAQSNLKMATNSQTSLHLGGLWSGVSRLESI